MINKIKHLMNKSKAFSYVIYIVYNLCGALTSFLFLLMRILPVKKNKIVCCNMKGKRYGDSPKYITDEIIKQKLDYEIVWLIKPEYKNEVPKGVRAVNYNMLNIAYELATSHFWIDTNTKPLGCLKRKNQYYIQAWHGTPLKKIYGDILDKVSPIDARNLKYNSGLQDLMLSNCKFNTNIFRRAFWHKGEILECGSPRNDLFFHDCEKYSDKVKKFFHIQEKKLVLYAPTFRKDLGLDEYNLDFKMLRRSLGKRFGGEWVVLVRLHPYNIADAEKFIEYSDNVMNATDYSDIQELLAACDVLITDYSSCMFDFADKKAPCFMYATDVEKYKGERDLYLDVYKLPFPLAENNEEMEINILSFDNQKYEEDLRMLFDEMGMCDNGNAGRQVVEWIVEHT